MICVERRFLKEWDNLFWQLKLFLILRERRVHGLLCMTMTDGVDQRVKIKCGKVRILGFDVDNIGCMIPGQMNKLRQVVVQVWEGNLVLGTDWLADNDFVDVVKLVPIIVLIKNLMLVF